VNKILKAVELSTKSLMAGMLMVILALTFTQVFLRYVLNSPIFWLEELVRYIFVWMSFLGASLAFRYGFHPAVDFLTQKAKGIKRRLIRLYFYALTFSVVTVMLVTGIKLTWLTRLNVTPAMEVSYSWLYGSVPVAGTLMFINLLGMFWEDFSRKPIREGGDLGFWS